MAWKLNDEPAAVFGGAAELIRQLIPMLILFGVVAWTKEQLVAVMAFVSVFLTFLTILFTRSSTIPVARANSQIETAVTMPQGTTVKEVIAEEKRTSDPPDPTP